MPISQGLLYYLPDGELKVISQDTGELSGLLLRRNELASYIHLGSLPLPPNTSPPCLKCSQRPVCGLYLKIEQERGATLNREREDGLTLTLTPPSIPQPLTEDLNLFWRENTQWTYFEHWDRLIELEKKETVKLKREILLLSSKAREKKGNCLSEMVLFKAERSLDSLSWLYHFRKALSSDCKLLSLDISPSFSFYDDIYDDI
jgi:DNA replication ATP-dependent helicase Dna2